MRLADMVVEVAEVLPAPPEAVWALLTDVERMGGLGPENVRNRWDGDERGVGARFVGSNEREGLGAWDVGCTVVAWDPPERFGWVTGAPGRPSAEWSYELTPVDGGTLVRQRFAHGPGSTYLRDAVERRLERRAEDLRAGMTAVLRAAAGLLAG